jgi:hypothetical protein
MRASLQDVSHSFASNAAGAHGPAGPDDVADAAAQLRAARDGEGGAEGGTCQAMGERQVHAETPGTKAMIQGAIVVARVAAKAAML